MKQFTPFASKFRINSLLCCSAVVLLTACGGNMDTGSTQLSATAASISTDAGTAVAASTAGGSTEAAAEVEAIAEAAPAGSTEAAPLASAEAAPAANAETANTAGATGPAADLTTQAFELSGYDSTPMQAQAGQQEAGAHALASGTGLPPGLPPEPH